LADGKATNFKYTTEATNSTPSNKVFLRFIPSPREYISAL
jgi:hypothetical protein